MDTPVSSPRATSDAIAARGPLILAVLGTVLFFFAWIYQGDERGYWLPGLGLGVTLISWFGWRIVPVLAVELLVARWLTSSDASLLRILADTLLHTAHMGLGWWLYASVAQGARRLDDPRSATVFLILVPGGLAAASALLQAFVWTAWEQVGESFHVLTAQLLLSRIVGILVVTPFLMLVVNPWLWRLGVLSFDLPPKFFRDSDGVPRSYGDRIELAGLTLATSGLAQLLLWSVDVGNWMLWGCVLILIVWTCIRQGVRGGCFSASVASALVLVVAQSINVTIEHRASVQGHLLSFCSSALLFGVSASWIRANETRFRHVVNRIPFVLYSARLPYGIPSSAAADAKRENKRDSKPDLHTGPSIAKLADVVLVSPAARQVLAAEPDALLGPFASWVERIDPDDRELLVASLAQLCLQKKPVTCEYRIHISPDEVSTQIASGGASPRTTPTVRWLRETMTPHYSEDGVMDGWEGLIEDITDQRALSQNLRKMTNMLQALISNLPTGVYFVQGPTGNPILVNARARQLLGQREDISAGLEHLSQVYRLHKPDGSEYPWQELPVAKALKQGIACRASDIVVHRADGRRIPLIAWATPIDLQNSGTPDAAVWVLEDWTAMQQAEAALRESEVRLRAIIEAMGEGVIVQDAAGAVLECNAAACAILDVPREQIVARRGWVFGDGCLREDGAVFPSAELPDQRALRLHQPVRGVIVGVPTKEGVRWLHVNSMPFPVGPAAGLNHQKARVVTTFADITLQRHVQDSLRLTRDKYQNLVETIPFMLLQRDRNFDITYVNSAATHLTGHSADEMMAPGFCEGIIHPDDLPAYFHAAEVVSKGKSTRVEIRFRAKGGAEKTVVAFIYPIFQDSAYVGCTCLVVDITMQRRLEEELHEAKRLELVGRLASGTVHDFNNLLQILIGLAGLAKNEVPRDQSTWQHLTRIEEVGEQAAHLAGQILTFSKQRPKQRHPVDLNAVISQTLKLAKTVMPSDIELETELDPAAPIVQGDETPLKQVLMNLCLNARDAMPRGGRLVIRTHSAGSAPPGVNGVPWVHLSIQDTGQGMEEAVQQRIFEPFFSTKEHGTGLGLSVVQRIVQELGGHIEVSSKLNEGTRFDIWLKAVEN